MRKLYRFHWDCGRMGNVEGVFVADEVDIDAAIGQQVYFGEILGKHSEIAGPLEPADVKVLSDDQDFIAKLIEVFGSTNISGYNPLSFIGADEEY